MKTKLFYLFIAMFLFSVSGKSQNPVITLIGSGNGGWTDTAETTMLTSDGITYTLVDRVLSTGEVKFREGKCWTGGCPATVNNKFGWGPAVSTQTGWPSGVNNAPADNGPNIQSQAGVWTITFNRILGSWSFVPGTPLPVIKLVGTGVVAAAGATLTTENGTLFTAKKVPLKPGSCKFDIDGVSYGPATPPSDWKAGTADNLTGNIAVPTTGIDYDVTFNYLNGAYTFTVATFPTIALVGSAAGGWPTGAVGEIDDQVMTTTDGITYSLKNIPIVGGVDQKCLFRVGNAWNIKYGQQAGFPTGTNAGGQDIEVFNTTSTGTYDVTLNTVTGAYNFTKITYALVGSAAGGWPTGAPGEVDDQVMTTANGINYTLTNIPIVGGPDQKCLFRANNAWNIKYGQKLGFPAGTNDGGQDIEVFNTTSTGTYNVTLNVLTGVYNFGTPLAVNKFDQASFKAYPNPTTDSWNIVSGNDDITSIQVFDVLGKSVYARTAASKEVTVNASELSRGVYYAKVATANGESTVKLVKE